MFCLSGLDFIPRPDPNYHLAALIRIWGGPDSRNRVLLGILNAAEQGNDIFMDLKAYFKRAYQGKAAHVKSSLKVKSI
jgi:hypothetical protein